MTLSQELQAGASELWRTLLRHPFVEQMARGTLPIEALACWVRQDYPFLVEYCRVLGLTAARAPDFRTLAKFAELLDSTAHTEMELHREYAREFGISEAELEREPKLPACRAYTDFLVRTAATADFPVIVAALLPCMWGYAEIGREIGSRPRPSDDRLARWIDMYADSQFQALSDWCRSLLDQLGSEVGAGLRAEMQAAFTASVQHELSFFDMALSTSGGTA